MDKSRLTFIVTQHYKYKGKEDEIAIAAFLTLSDAEAFAKQCRQEVGVTETRNTFDVYNSNGNKLTGSF